MTMSSLSQPFWIQLSGNPFKITDSIQWPLINAQIGEFPELSKLANSFLEKPTNFFSIPTNSVEGNLYLIYQSGINGYRGIWVPHSYPSLSELVKSILENWTDESSEFNEWIQQFFAQRLREESLVNFQNNNFAVNLPPAFVLNHQQINGTLLHQMRSKVDSIADLSLDALYQILSENVPDQYKVLIDNISAENEMSVIHLIRTYLHSIEMISYDEYQHLMTIISKLSPTIAEFLTQNYFLHRIIQNKQLPEKIVESMVKKEQETSGMIRINILRVLTAYFKKKNDIYSQEKYFQTLMELSPKYSWNSKIDMVNSQIGLSRCSVSKGDYFRAMTFYSFAKQGFATMGQNQLTDEMEIEFQRISVLSASQLIQHGLYLMNHNDQGKNTILTLIDGVQASLAHFIKYHTNDLDLETILIPLLQSASSNLKIHQSLVDPLFEKSIDFDEIIETISLLGNLENRSKLIPMLQKHIEELSFKDQKTIERISVFSIDGRHIGDYHMKGGNFKAMDQNANQSLFSSAMSAVSMIIAEATETQTGVEEISIGNKTIIYHQGNFLTFCLIANSTNSSLKQLLRRIVEAVEDKYQTHLQNWSGNLNIFSDLPELLAPISFYMIDLPMNNDKIHAE